MSAFGKFLEDTGGNTGVVNTLIAALAGSFKGDPGLEAAEVVNIFGQLPAALTGAGLENSGSTPKAYLKYIVFDKDFTPFDAGNITTRDTDRRMLDGAPNDWQKLEMEVPITKNGYIYIYTANESTADVDVFFDDIEVQLIEGPAISGSDYYPFGLVMEGRSWTSEPYRFGYQGQFAEKDDETGWNAFEARMYDPVVGRWLTRDPAREFYSPYVSMGNDPINSIDPDGRDRIHRNTETGETFTEATGFLSFDWLFGDTYFDYSSEEWDQLGLFYYFYEDNGFPGHSGIINARTGEVWEVQHPLDGEGQIVNGAVNKYLNKGPKSVGYYYEDIYSSNSGFWSYKERGDLKLAGVVVPNGKATLDFLNSYKGKAWKYNICTDNCKDFVHEALIQGGLNLKFGETETWSAYPSEFMWEFNSEIKSKSGTN